MRLHRAGLDGLAARTTLGLLVSLALTSALPAPTGAQQGPMPPPSQSSPAAQASTQPELPYDREYPLIGYSGKPLHNAIAHLQTLLDGGEVKLRFKQPRGYLDSLLAALSIDPSSQTLVYSKTSLQAEAINAATPRAIYFNDDTYVSWIPGTSLIEIATMDNALGQVFYILNNVTGAAVTLERETGACLACHDTYSLLGGGVPRFLFLSSTVSIAGDTLTGGPGIETTDETPLEERWGGWYVTGHDGHQKHLGNLLVRNEAELADPSKGRHRNLQRLDGLLDIRPYLTNKSDIVALLVLEHQVYVKNLLTRARFKASNIVARLSPDTAAPSTWEALPPAAQKALRPMFEGLVRALLFVHAARIDGPISGGSGFDVWFQRQGPRDPSERSLRQLDLKTRLFRYPLSYIVYSQAFDALPGYMQDYLYRRIAAVVKGHEQGEDFAHLSAEDRKAILEILLATKPVFARYAAG
jgi:hypothetical protein